MSTNYITRLIAEAEQGDLYAIHNLGLLGWEAFHAPWEQPPSNVVWSILKDHPGLKLAETLEMIEFYGF
ncbi:MAG: hypothetical protein IPN91_03545 [Holophagaceae bacterium]|uniref:Uncharacterized protein n=1 Tax=Candidatus Geothrix odensensis TaxID=2954440 RepID=A0A936F055_9BACT|nr:hypothetical protein [Candidatus Geothrix odensensis]